jgi:predicted PhzF superfamily epimerase YddE/YHI9/RimJ/RimL family protein N-acetyltransferase
MSKLAIEVGTPISCFVKVIKTEAHVTFFAQNGQEDGFCGHGLISVIKHLKENNLEHISALISASGVKLNARVLENGMCSLEIPVFKFEISSWNLPDFANFFELQKQDILEAFRTNPLGDIAIEVASPKALKNITLDAKKVDEFSKEHNIRIMIFFCKGSSFDEADVEIRVFCSKLYELEDIVCGSANISVSNILFKKYGISKYNVIQPFNYLKTGKVGGYQEVEYLPEKHILILNGFAEAKKERFVFEPLDIEFDEACNPVSRNEDYYFLRDILTDIEVMKTSTFFAGGLADNDYDLHKVMNSLIEKEEQFKKDYGLQKVYNTELNEYIGVTGLIRCEKKFSNYSNNIVEVGTLLTSSFIGKGFGLAIDLILAKKVEDLNVIVMASIWEENITSIKLAQKVGMIFLEKSSKIYNRKKVIIDIYVKFPKSINNTEKLVNIENFLITKQVA